MRASHFVPEGVSRLGRAHGDLKIIAFNKEIMFGIIINNDSLFCSALNHSVIIGKYFLYVLKALNGKFYILVEKYISCTTGREKS